ncbi:hypothetical protein A605_05565 [Corynebacterium halotolerans YIM 70093 = DSM 44683]|uniref:Solute-binding protein family 5 domain-containing protein n=1 Tax=Corynebacterium halotolerans YIM 70093 = DSM 44683 TaxID=1121362 RepID=M1MWK6_9CORY|nr:hypothetical protein A605_05565 [Corynebacterium halotolerans YIM 70093 = DSM 44683]
MGLLATALCAALAACSANPGPPPVEEATPTTETATQPPAETTATTPTTTTPPSRAEAVINIGVDPLRNGMNPHLIADDSAFVRALASLVLPSAFRDGEMDTDVLESAGEVEPPSPEIAQTVRYVISPSAQWSDGTPITGSDFRYLWQGMVNTPGVVDPAGYQAIADVRVSSAGRTVDVDFARPVAEWRSLFTHLLPSHLFQPGAEDFAEALLNDIPASGGRYMVHTVDRARGVIALNRNDRFWGEDPAETDRVIFRAIRDDMQGTDQMRSGQIDFLAATPTETSVAAYSLMTDTQVRTVDQPRELQLTLSATSPLLGDVAARAELHSLIDVPLIARLAAGRSSQLPVPEHQPARGENAPPPELLQQLTADRPLRLAADPTDVTASAAVRSLVDLLSQWGVAAEIVSTDLGEITGELLPAGEVDAVIAWDHTDGSGLDLASSYLCPPVPGAPRAGNLSGYCTPETDELVRAIVAGTIDPATAAGVVEELNAAEHLVIPLLGDRRVLVLGEGIVGPDPDLDNWTAGIPTVATWRTL